MKLDEDIFSWAEKVTVKTPYILPDCYLFLIFFSGCNSRETQRVRRQKLKKNRFNFVHTYQTSAVTEYELSLHTLHAVALYGILAYATNTKCLQSTPYKNIV